MSDPAQQPWRPIYPDSNGYLDNVTKQFTEKSQNLKALLDAVTQEVKNGQGSNPEVLARLQSAQSDFVLLNNARAKHLEALVGIGKTILQAT